MVNKKHTEDTQDDVDITNENTDMHEPEIEELEEKQTSFNNTLRDKLKTCEAEKRTILEESQRTKADFLNARRRLEEERLRDRERSTIKHIESLIPLCDSFQVAMSNKEVWEKADANWRKGIEGINAQLHNILTANNVYPIDPTGKEFSPHHHEALSTIPVPEADSHDKVVGTIQLGYEFRKPDGSVEIIRPARVIIGVHEQK
jgi:molecular chaperone GrpE